MSHYADSMSYLKLILANAPSGFLRSFRISEIPGDVPPDIHA